MKDLFEKFGNVLRKVEKGERDGRPTYTMISESTYKTDPEDLWDALTNKERLPRWFTEVEGDLKLGGKYQVKNNASGTITSCEENKGFALTWEYAGDVSWVSVELTAHQANQTQLRLKHLAFAEGEHFQLYGPGAVGLGWDLTVYGLCFHIRTQQPTPDESSLATSPDYKNFVSVAAKAWGEASVHAGFDRESSLKAAKKTELAYLGES